MNGSLQGKQMPWPGARENWQVTIVHEASTSSSSAKVELDSVSMS